MLVIDDQDFSYGQLFVRDGYSIEQWHDVTTLTTVDDGKYDLLLLDLQGVGRQESSEQGFGVLKYLRTHCPTLIIVAYSNADWGLKYQEFFKLADAVLPKSADYVDFKRRVDELLTNRFSLGFYMAKVQTEVASYELDRGRLEHLIRVAILNGKSKRLERYLETNSVASNILERVLAIIKVGAAIYQMWRPQ